MGSYSSLSSAMFISAEEASITSNLIAYSKANLLSTIYLVNRNRNSVFEDNVFLNNRILLSSNKAELVMAGYWNKTYFLESNNLFV